MPTRARMHSPIILPHRLQLNRVANSRAVKVILKSHRCTQSGSKSKFKCGVAGRFGEIGNAGSLPLVLSLKCNLPSLEFIIFCSLRSAQWPSRSLASRLSPLFQQSAHGAMWLYSLIILWPKHLLMSKHFDGPSSQVQPHIVYLRAQKMHIVVGILV
jgi:hypothetical protein